MDMYGADKSSFPDQEKRSLSTSLDAHTARNYSTDILSAATLILFSAPWAWTRRCRIGWI